MKTADSGKWIWAAALAAAILVFAVIAGWDRLQAALQQLWSVSDVREFSHDLVETVDPLEMGPTQELVAAWTSSRPVLDGVISPGEWDHAAVVEFDGTDRIRPGVASGRRDSVRDRDTSGLTTVASNHAVLHLMNDASAVFAAVEVTDDFLDFGEGDIAKRDSVEVFLSERPGQMSRFPGQPEHFFLVRGDGMATVGDLPEATYAAAVKPDRSGYVLEFSWQPRGRDSLFGFDVGINDSDDSGNEGERNQYFWNGTHDSVLSEGRECGRVHLSRQNDLRSPLGVPGA